MFETVTRDHVRQAIEECDELGADTFQRRYGFGQARHYVLWHDGRTYDSKAILGVAQRYATGTAAHAYRVRRRQAGRRAACCATSASTSSPTTARRSCPMDPTDEERQEASDLGNEAARSAWAGAAREILLEVAGRYHALVTYRELAGLVQLRTGIRTNQLVHYWIGDVLGRVARVCADRGEPLLSALCVKEDGSVGAGYAKAVIDVRGELVGDPDDHAADGAARVLPRLRCRDPRRTVARPRWRPRSPPCALASGRGEPRPGRSSRARSAPAATWPSPRPGSATTAAESGRSRPRGRVGTRRQAPHRPLHRARRRPRRAVASAWRGRRRRSSGKWAASPIGLGAAREMVVVPSLSVTSVTRRSGSQRSRDSSISTSTRSSRRGDRGEGIAGRVHRPAGVTSPWAQAVATTKGSENIAARRVSVRRWRSGRGQRAGADVHRT